MVGSSSTLLSVILNLMGAITLSMHNTIDKIGFTKSTVIALSNIDGGFFPILDILSFCNLFRCATHFGCCCCRQFSSDIVSLSVIVERQSIRS